MKHSKVIVSRLLISDRTNYEDEELLGGDGPMEGIWVVSWPEHVITPEFNCDANYLGPYKSVKSALEDSPGARIHRDMPLDWVTFETCDRDEWIAKVHKEDWGGVDILVMHLDDVAGVDGDDSDDVWPYVQCSGCGKPYINLAYKGHLNAWDESFKPENDWCDCMDQAKED